ncbi:Acyl-coenzyme A thioesterase 2, mitochondrial [Oryzias melastigma]|uniref:Acyl-coenzyme A thioesterase 2, mitochondrial n=1 Tax=Oryzias melastigma TaxID=30732 RepID=A0A834KYN2_ORYME|nr:Acyl-coenzyme A thioesterase 2, mitochondrial [Oryzias melastigma]
MFRSHVSVTTIRQVVEINTKHRLFSPGKLTPGKRIVGSMRWESSTRPAPLLTATPVRTLVDEQTCIKASFLPSNHPVTVCARMRSDEGDLWQSFAHYNTNSSGMFNLNSDHSVGGSYSGCEPMGLFWSMQPAPGEREGLRLRKKCVESPYTVQISLLEGHVSPNQDPGKELAAVTAERWYMSPGVKRQEIRQNGLVGTLFIPPGPGPFPAMLDMWGMGGGLPEYRSSLFASRGYASFCLAYVGHKDLPGPSNTVNVGDSYFKAAFQFLQEHSQISADRIGIVGLSYGCYLTLHTGTLPGVKPACLIGINGPVGSSRELLHVNVTTKKSDQDQVFWSFDDQGYVIFKQTSLPSNLHPESIVKLEEISCPLMYIVGEDDLSASSIENADLIEKTLRAAGKSHLFTRLSYPGAGHLIEPPYSPMSRASFWVIKPEKLMTLWGGHPAPHAAAQEDAWRKMLAFMELSLRR